jgi:hypothetical protein
MVLSRRRIRGLFVSGALALVFSAVPARALADGFVTADYSGTWDEAFVYQPSNPSVWQESMRFVWDERETARVGGGSPSAFATVRVLSRTLTITGTITATLAPPNQAMSCTGKYSIRLGGRFPLTITAGSFSNPLLTIFTIAPLSGMFSQAGGTGFCTYPVNGSAMTAGGVPGRNFGVPLTPLFSFKLNRRMYTKSYKTFDINPDGTKQIAVSAVFRAATNGNRPPALPPLPPLATPVRDQAKRNALNAMRTSVFQALYPCGVGVGVGLTLLAGGPAGVAAGLVLAGTGSPLCLAQVKTITDEHATYRDPPRNDYFVVARVAALHGFASRSASCSQFSASTKAFCLKAAAAAANLLAAVRQTGALAGAIQTTVSRDTAAANAHNQAAVNLQEQALTSLSSRFAAARRAQASAGAGLQAALGSGGVSVRISVAQFKRDTKSLLTAVARRGVRAVTLRKLARTALRPRLFDPIAAF